MSVTGFLSRMRASQLVRAAGTYTMVQVISALIPLILLPILTRHLEVAEYGIATMFATLAGFTNIVVGLSLHGAIQRAYFDKTVNHPRYVGSCLLVLTVSAVAAGCAAYLLRDPISAVFGVPASWLWVTIGMSWANGISLCVLTLWQVRMRALPYGALVITQTIVNFGLSILLVVHLALGWQGRVLAQVCGVVVCACAALVLALRNGWVTWAAERRYIRDALRFGLPLVPHAAGGAALYMIDRTLVTSIVGIDAAGIYMVAVQIGLSIGLAAEAFNRAYSPWLFGHLSALTPKQGVRIVRFTYAYGVAALIGAVAFGLGVPTLLRHLVGDQYVAAGPIIIWIAVAQAFAAMYYMVANYIYYTGRTEILAAATLLALGVNGGLGYLLTTRNGIMGAAQASATAFLAYFIVTWLGAAHVYRMPWLSALRRDAPSAPSGPAATNPMVRSSIPHDADALR